jgi:hypothetical protein
MASSFDGRYTRIKSKFWTNEEVREWDTDTRYLALYLLTSPHNNMIGLHILPKSYICEDLQWDLSRLARSMDCLIDAGFIVYDEKYRLMLITHYLKNNPLDNPNQAKAAAKILDDLPHSYLLLVLSETIEGDERYIELYRQLLINGSASKESTTDKPLHKPFTEGLDEPFNEPYRKPVSVSISVTESETVSISPDKSDGESEDSPSMNEKPEEEKPKDIEPSLFEEAWKGYLPIHTSKGHKEPARDSWKRQLKLTGSYKITEQDLLSATLQYVLEHQRTGEWTSAMTTFLNQKQYRDHMPGVQREQPPSLIPTLSPPAPYVPPPKVTTQHPLDTAIADEIERMEIEREQRAKGL